MNPVVLIPAYNEGRAIGSVVREIKELGHDVIVVDDGSIDGTEKEASENGALVMRHAKNLGKGASIRDGVEFILKKTNFDAIIIMDGDGQHNPKDIEKFISHAESQSDDIVIGTRMHSTDNMPFVRLGTNKFMSGLLSSICKQSIPDTQCGFRLIRRKVFETLELKSHKYDFESEILIKASQNKFKIASVPIETIYRDELSKIHPIKDTLRFMGLIIKSYLGKH